MSSTWRVLLAAAMVVFAAPAFAQRGGGAESGEALVFLEYAGRETVSERLRPHGVDLLGDQIDLNTGALAFEQIDISLPGNSRPPTHKTEARFGLRRV